MFLFVKNATAKKYGLSILKNLRRNRFETSLTFCLFFYIIFPSAIAQNKLEPLLKNLKITSSNDTNYVNTLNKISYEWYKNKPDTAVILSENALIHAKKLSFYKGVINSYRNIGLTAQIQGNYTKAVHYLDSAIAGYEKLMYPIGMIDCLNGKGRALLNQGNTEKALNLFLTALKLSEKCNDLTQKANTLDNMGIIYLAQKNHIASLDYFSQALSLREKANDRSGIALDYSNLGILYTEKKDFNRSEACYKQALMISEEIQDEHNILKNTSLLGFNAVQQNKYDQAMLYFSRAIPISQRLGDKDQLASIYSAIGDIYQRQPNQALSFQYHQKAMFLAQQIGANYILKQAYKGLYGNYKQFGNSPLALYYHELYTNMQDSLTSLKASERIADLQTKYETNKRKNEINLLKSKNLLVEKSASQNAWQRNTFIIAFLLLSILVFMLINSNHDRKLTNNKLMLQNAEINRQKEELDIQKNEIIHKNEELEKLNNTKDKFFSIIAHDLRSPIASFAAFAELLSNFYEEMTVDEVKFIATDLEKSVKNLNRLTDNLLTWARIQMKQVEPEPKNIHINPIIMEVVETLQPIAKSKNVQIQIEPYDPVVYVDENYLRFIVRNLLSNAIKFSNPGGGVIIGNRLKNKFINIWVADTGVGMSNETMENLFDSETKRSIKGTAGEKGTGLGLMLCKEFVEKSGGKIWVETQIGKGSIFSFSLKPAMPENFKDFMAFMDKKPPYNVVYKTEGDQD